MYAIRSYYAIITFIFITRLKNYNSSFTFFDKSFIFFPTF